MFRFRGVSFCFFRVFLSVLVLWLVVFFFRCYFGFVWFEVGVCSFFNMWNNKGQTLGKERYPMPNHLSRNDSLSFTWWIKIVSGQVFSSINSTKMPPTSLKKRNQEEKPNQFPPKALVWFADRLQSQAQGTAGCFPLPWCWLEMLLSAPWLFPSLHTYPAVGREVMEIISISFGLDAVVDPYSVAHQVFRLFFSVLIVSLPLSAHFIRNY